MMGLVSKCVVFFICIYLIAADPMEPPPCEQIARNQVMCASNRFKKICAKECGSAQSQNRNGNGNGQGGNSSGAKNREEPRTSKTTEAPTTTEQVTTTTTEKPTTTASSPSTKKSSGSSASPSTARARSGSDKDSHEDSHGDSHEKHSTSKSSTTRRPSTSSSGGNRQNKKNCNKVDPCVEKAAADAGFRRRCEAAGVVPTCLDKCRYDVTFDELKKAILGKQCPVDGMREYLKAGANQQDNRSCCEQTGVLEGKRAFCHPFCNPNGAEWPAPNQAMKYLPCSSQLAAIMRCHWAGLTE